MCRIAFWTAMFCVAAAVCPAAGRGVVSNTYEDFNVESGLENLPVTFSRVGARGDFTEGRPI